MNVRQCLVRGCKEIHLKARGLCEHHYRQWYYGTLPEDALPAGEAPLLARFSNSLWCVCTDPLPDPSPWGMCPDCGKGRIESIVNPENRGRAARGVDLWRAGARR